LSGLLKSLASQFKSFGRDGDRASDKDAGACDGATVSKKLSANSFLFVPFGSQKILLHSANTLPAFMQKLVIALFDRQN
jgi:hypothetical protein